jgi:hypothetical protein
MTATADPAGTTQVTYQVVNVLGRLQVEKPRIADRVLAITEYARIVKYVLSVIDGYADRSGKDLAEIARDVRHGRIEVRCVGSRITVVVP